MRIISLTFTLFLLGAISCQRDPDSFPSELQNIISPTVSINISDIKVTKATVSVTINPDGNLNVYRLGIVWDTLPNPTATSNSIEWIDPLADMISHIITNLKPATTYYVRAYAIDKNGSLIWSEQHTLQTKAHWTLMKPFPGMSNSPGAFYLNGLAYFGGGHGSNNGDFWAFDPINNTWEKKQNYPAFGGRAGITGFVINNIGYFGTGSAGPVQKTFFKYDPILNQWQTLQDFAGMARSEAVSFTIGNTGYLGFGDGEPGAFSDLWAFNPITETWTEVGVPFPGEGRTMALAFVIDDKAYIGFGHGPGWAPRLDFYQFDPSQSNPWKEMNSTNIYRTAGYAFSVNRKGYIGGGLGNKDFWEFDPYGSPDGKGKWTQLEPPNYEERNYATGLSIGDRGILLGGTGAPGISYKECWIFCPE